MIARSLALEKCSAPGPTHAHTHTHTQLRTLPILSFHMRAITFKKSIKIQSENPDADQRSDFREFSPSETRRSRTGQYKGARKTNLLSTQKVGTKGVGGKFTVLTRPVLLLAAS